MGDFKSLEICMEQIHSYILDLSIFSLNHNGLNIYHLQQMRSIKLSGYR